jgi:hypothetical protein
MFKLRSFLIAAAFVMLLSVTNWQASFASAGEGQLSGQSDKIQSYAPVLDRIQCVDNFVPNSDNTKCICPDGRKIDQTGKCKKIEDEDFKKPNPKPTEPCVIKSNREKTCK